MLADTAKLAVQLDLTGNFTSGLVGAEAGLSRFSGSMGRVTSAFSKVGGALSHAGSQIKGLITGPLGLIGLTGGLLSSGGAIGATLGKLNDLAFGTEKLQALTGGSAQTLSTLIATTEKYGITLESLTVTAGFYEKTVGKLGEATATTTKAATDQVLADLELRKAKLELTNQSVKHIDVLIKERKAYDQLHPSISTVSGGLTKLQALEKQYGVVLTDNTGKALSFDQAILAVADVYSKSTDKATAAALAATLFGRSYTNLIPVLALGRQGILDLETEAAKMGLQLSDQNVADFAKYREAIRGSQEAISGLEVAIGIDLLPTIIDLANGVKSFVTDHKADIVAFFNGAVSAAKTAAQAIGGFVSFVGGVWNSIPPEFRDLMTKGLVADRTIKFLFGFSPLESAASGIFGQFFARGSSPANPVFVAGLGGSNPLNLLSLLPALLAGGAIVAAGYVAGQTLFTALGGHPVGDPLHDPSGTTIAPGVKLGMSQGEFYRNQARQATYPQSSAGDRWAQEAHNLTATMSAGDKSFREMHAALVANTAAIESWAHWATRTLTERLQHPLAPHSYVNALLTKADKIANSSETTAQKIKDLEAIKAKLDAGNHHQAYYLQRIIAAEKAQKPPVVNVTTNVRINSIAAVRLTTTNTTWRNTSGGPVIS